MTEHRLAPAVEHAGAVGRGCFRIGDRGFAFAAAHRLEAGPVGHRARRLHGHTWTVEVRLSDRALTEPGFVADFAELEPVGAYLTRELDHRNLSELFDFPTTAKRLGQHLRAWFLAHMTPTLARQLAGIQVWAGPLVPEASASTVRFGFEAAHHLDGLPPGHKCGQVHGHSYAVDVVLAETSTQHGHRLDLACLADYLLEELDYRDLTERLPFPPTAELLAEHLYMWVAANASPAVSDALQRVRVWESPRRWAEFVGEALRR